MSATWEMSFTTFPPLSPIHPPSLPSQLFPTLAGLVSSRKQGNELLNAFDKEVKTKRFDKEVKARRLKGWEPWTELK